MAKDIIAYIKQKVKEYDSTIDTRNSAAIVDLMINPLSTILEPYDRQHNALLIQISMLDPESLSEKEMDLIAANFLVSRTQGSKATGNVKIYFNEPRDFTLSANTEIRSDTGLKFYTTRQYSISSNEMTNNNQRYPLYSTGDISVEAEFEGLDYDIGPGEIKEGVSINTTYAYVTNLIGFSGGGTKQTNTEVHQDIMDSVANKLTPTGMGNLLKENFTSIETVVVKGMTDDEMIRDMVFNTNISGLLNWNGSEYYETDFYGVVSGYHEYPYNQSIAYYGLFQDNPATSGYDPQDLPELDDFTSEFTQDMYANIFRRSDNLSTQIQSEIVLNEPFTTVSEDLEFPKDWSRSDADLELNAMIGKKEIEIDTSEAALRLGYRYDETDTRTQPILWPSVSAIEQLITLVQKAHQTNEPLA